MTIREVLEEVFLTKDDMFNDEHIRPRIAQAEQEIRGIIEGMRKATIDIKKKMCCDGEYPRPCLYDVPEAETCRQQDKGIPKEKCSNYKDVQQEYEDFYQYNQAISDITEKLFGEG